MLWSSEFVLAEQNEFAQLVILVPTARFRHSRPGGSRPFPKVLPPINQELSVNLSAFLVSLEMR